MFAKILDNGLNSNSACQEARNISIQHDSSFVEGIVLPGCTFSVLLMFLALAVASLTGLCL